MTSCKVKGQDTVLTLPPLCRQLLQSPGGAADLLQVASEGIRSPARGPADEVGSLIAASSTGESQRSHRSPVKKGGPGVHGGPPACSADSLQPPRGAETSETSLGTMGSCLWDQTSVRVCSTSS